MKKVLSILRCKSKWSVATSLLLAGALLLPGGALAQSGSGGGTSQSTQALLEQIQALLRQIQDLQNRINELRTQQAQTASQISDLLTTLKQGDQGEKVKVLQALLAADAAIYPEALVTGFYGRLTAEAVKRFQRRHGFEQVGFVGPKTLRKLNELLQEHPLALEDRDDEDEDEDEGRMKDVQKQNKKTAKALGEVFGKEVCAIVPPGHLIAPGWLKKHGKPLIPPCQVLPPGIAAKLGITVPAPTSTPDTAAPAIGGVAAQNLTANSAVIVWSTNEPATSKVYYGTISPLNLATASMTSQSALVTSHSVPLTGLNASTTYHYVVESKDGPGNTATSSPQSFTTASQVDATAPSVTSQSVTPATSSATVSWTTNELADSQIFYGTSVAYGSSTALDATLATVHSQTISGLTPNTRYFYQVRSKDASQNLGTQAGEFTTLPPADTAAPLISGVAATLVGSSTATIIWTTDEAATSKVYYGTLLPLDLATAAFTTTSGLGMNHSVPLSGLNASSTYYYAVESKDAANNTAVSATSSQQFTTTP